MAVIDDEAERIRTGGPAFPCDIAVGEGCFGGMTLLDYFAGQVLAGADSEVINAAGIQAARRCSDKNEQAAAACKILATYCYEIAEAMVAEHNRIPGQATHE